MTLTRREAFAAMAMQGLLASQGTAYVPHCNAAYAVECADALVLALDGPKGAEFERARAGGAAARTVEEYREALADLAAMPQDGASLTRSQWEETARLERLVGA